MADNKKKQVQTLTEILAKDLTGAYKSFEIDERMMLRCNSCNKSLNFR